MKYSITVLFLLSIFLSGWSQPLTEQIDQLYSSVVSDGLVDYASVSKPTVASLIKQIEKEDISLRSIDEQVAFYINAYNITVMHSVLSYYPTITSVEDQSSFFKQKHTIAGQSFSLDGLEKHILGLYPSGDIHFALNCGAISCPPLVGQAFRGGSLAEQLNAATKAALQNPRVLKETDSELQLSKIFQWYTGDFDNDPLEWIAQRYLGDIPQKKIKYMAYDWRLNDVAVAQQAAIGTAEDLRYFASNLYSNGSYEINTFHNYYSQVDGSAPGFRSNWFTSTWTFLYGLNRRINIGIDLRIRATTTGTTDQISTFGALRFPSAQINTNANGEQISTGRAGLSAVGLRIKYQPLRRYKNLTVQHIVYTPTIQYNEAGFLDWESPYVFNDVFYDKLFGTKHSIFASAGLHVENINGALLGTSDGFYQVSTPINVIYSYFPTKKATLYLLANYAPRWGTSVSNGGQDAVSDWVPFGQLGAGYKYFITDDIQAEVLYTKFYDNIQGRSADTYNIGVRYYGW